MNGRRTDGDEATRAAAAIRKFVETASPGQLLRHAVVVVQTEGEDGAHTATHYPFGAPDVATERAMLERAADRLRHGR